MNTGPHYSTRGTCRLCGTPVQTDLFDLGNQYVSTFIDKPTAESPEVIKCPLVLFQCPSCSLVQQRYTARQDFLYTRHYWYKSGVTDTMKAALADITRELEDTVELCPGDIVLDIGSNDGTLLRSYTTPGIVRVGVEPATNLAGEGAEGIDVFINNFWSYKNYWLPVGKKAQVITAIGMFYDLEEPLAFVRDISDSLADNGVFVAQLMLLQDMLMLKDVGNLAHEHLEFYTLESLNKMFGACGLEIFDIDRNNVNGSSTRLYIKKMRGKVYKVPGADHRLKKFAAAEEDYRKYRTYRAFYSALESNKKLCYDFLWNARAAGERVYGYGASTKGNVILQYYGIDNSLVQCIAERSKEKWGKYTVGTDIPIMPEDAVRDINPEYLLVLPYAFMSEFIKREGAWLDKGGKFLVPLPEFKVL